MNKNYREWGSTGLGSAFQSKLSHLRDLHDLELLASKNVPLVFAPEEVESGASPSQLPLDKESLLYNRSHFNHSLEYEIGRALRYHRHLSVCLLRIDNLDGMRNRCSFQEVGRLIFRLARVFKDSLRGIDIPARFDDSSFAVILPETNADGAAAVAERIQSVLRVTTCKGSSKQFSLRPRIGFACFPAQAKTASGLIDAAMKSMEASAGKVDIA